MNNCQTVRFGYEAIKSMLSIREVELSNIKNLTFDEFSLSWDGYYQERTNDDYLPSVSVTVTNSIIRSISTNAFNGIYEDINFKNVIIDDISQYAFSLSSIRVARNIAFYNVTFTKIAPQAFKKFHLEALTFDGSTFQEIPSRAFSDLNIYNKFEIRNCKIGMIRSYAFLIYQPREFQVIKTEIGTAEGEGFKVTTRGTVIFKDVYFKEVNYGAFKGLSLNVRELNRKDKIYFNNVKFGTLNSEFLNVNETSFVIEINKVQLSFVCDCKTIDLTFKETNYYGEINCVSEENDKKFVNLKEYKQRECSFVESNVTLIVIVSVVVILLVIVISILLFYYKKIYRSDRYGDRGKKGQNGHRHISMIVPDGKTYKETELHVIVERADLLTTDL